MKSAFARVVRKQHISIDEKLIAWKVFEKTFTEDNPYSVEDDTMRNEVWENIARLEQKKLQQLAKKQKQQAKEITKKEVSPPVKTKSFLNKATSQNLQKQLAIAWIENNNMWGKNSRIVIDFNRILQKAIGNKKNCIWKIGWGLTKSMKPYLLTWQGNTFTVVQLTIEDARKQGFKEKNMSMIFTKKQK